LPGRDVAAKRYAEAVLALARAHDTLDRWQADLETLRALLTEPTVAAYLQSTTIDEARKFAILDQALPEMQPLARNFARLLVRKRRTALAGQIADAFRDAVNVLRGIVIAQVTTAQPLTDPTRAAVQRAVTALTGARTVRLQEQVNRDLIGGLVLRIGDHIIDGSVRTRLAALKRNIAGQMA